MSNNEPSSQIHSENGVLIDPEKPQYALLVGVYSGLAQKKICEEHLDELSQLADTFGVPTVAKIPCPLRKITAATYLQDGKIEELALAVKEKGATVVIFDEEITPAQQRNLEKSLKVPVMDRTELILEIFAQRAKTKEARIQIELASTKYQFPRLKRLWSHLSRQRSGGVYLKGEGEKQIEIDRRLLKAKLEKLEDELEEVKNYRETQRASRQRSGIPTFAIIGYTNAGKSTLLNALTEANVFVEDKLFATLDPTTRKYLLPNNQEILLTDTVGFIRKLPHTLVAAFKSTLEEAVHDDILIHLIDISHPMAEEHALATLQILKELNADTRPRITVFNKIDRCENLSILEHLRFQFPKTVAISALNKEGFIDLFHRMVDELSALRETVKLRIPQSDYLLVSEIKREGKILFQDYEENDVVLRAEIPKRYLYRFKKYFEKEES